LVAAIVCRPAVVALHDAPLQDPSGWIENVVVEVTSPRELPYWSRPSALKVREPPAVMDEEFGETARWSSGPAMTVSEPVLVLPPLFPVTVCGPATVAVQTLAVHDPSGEIENDVPAVTSPTELPAVSNPSAV
jgi:hypothetical protein